MSHFDAVVYGAGPVGAAVALGLQQRGHKVCVREKRTERQVVIDAGKSINLSLSTRGRALRAEARQRGSWRRACVAPPGRCLVTDFQIDLSAAHTARIHTRPQQP